MLIGTTSAVRRRAWRLAAALLVTASASATAHAQDADAATEIANRADEDVIVVTARQSGAPMWTLRAGTSTVLLVGEILNVPEATPWRPDALEAAGRLAQHVILGTRAKVSPGDILRVIFSGGRLARLPEGRTTADYLSPELQQRLVAFEQLNGRRYTQQSLLISAFDLIRRTEFSRDTADSATDVVRSAARRARISTQPVGTIRGEDLLDNLFDADPATHVPCLSAAMSALDAGPDGVALRGRSWTRSDIPAVMASPIEQALDRCWPWTDGAFGPELRAQWTAAIREAMTRPNVTMAVVPLRILAEESGVLDQLDALDVDLTGPRWRE